eukprot:183795-Chlamydomonas_euryale.AAC.1
MRRSSSPAPAPCTAPQPMFPHMRVQIVFSSSCTVYGIPEKVPITEDTPLKAISPYGRTKLFQEDMFRDLAVGCKDFRILLL